MASKPLLNDYRATPYLICRKASNALDWYKTAFSAIEMVRMADPSGKIMHAEFRIGAAPIMIADEFPDMGYKSPESIGGSSVSIHVLVDDVDLTYGKAIKLGAKELMAVASQFDGERRGSLIDPYGHISLLATRFENVSFPEMSERFRKMMTGGQ
jgi:PhnB protein